MTTGYLPFDKALEAVLAAASIMKTERIELSETLHRVLATDAASDVDMPPFDSSAMDGFACRAEDRDSKLAIIETIAAGAMPRNAVTPGKCSRIMTGAPVPRGADIVVMFEDTEFDELNQTVTVVKKRDNRNIRQRAGDVCKGTIVLRKGTVIGAPHIAVLASIGKSTVTVFRQPRVGIIATGDELVEPSTKPRKGQIRNSNSYQLCAQVHATGSIPRYFGIVKDDPDALDQAIKNALHECDVLLLSGGVSMGDFDFVPGILKKNGVRLLFEKIAVKPGHPTIFGVSGKKRLFGMPGNPVSSFIVFEMLVRPFLFKTGGAVDPRINVNLTLASDLKRKKADRLEFLPVQLQADGGVLPVKYHGSAHIHAYTVADGIVAIPAGVNELPAGTVIGATLLR